MSPVRGWVQAGWAFLAGLGFALAPLHPAAADARSDVRWTLPELTRDDACVRRMFFAVTPPDSAMRDRCAEAFFTCEAQFGFGPDDPLPQQGVLAHDLTHCFRQSRQRFLTLAHTLISEWAEGTGPEALARRLDALSRVQTRAGGECGADHPALGPSFWRCLERRVLNGPLIPLPQEVKE